MSKILLEPVKIPYDVRAPIKNKPNITKTLSEKQKYRYYKTYTEPKILNKRNVEDENNLINILIKEIKKKYF